MLVAIVDDKRASIGIEDIDNTEWSEDSFSKGKGTGFQGRCFTSNQVGHIAKECKGNGTGAGKNFKGGRAYGKGGGAHNVMQDGYGSEGAWASWDDYVEAWGCSDAGNSSVHSGYTASLIGRDMGGQDETRQGRRRRGKAGPDRAGQDRE